MLTATSLGVTLPTGRVLFSGVNLTVEAGQAVAIHGPSGVGKSTLLFVLGSLMAPTTGEVNVIDAPTSPFAWVFQGLNVLPARSVLDNTMLNNIIDRESGPMPIDRACLALDTIGMYAFSNSRARSLSGGELQRVTVARAVASTRPIILADEPTNQLDSNNARRVMSLLAQQAEQGRAVVIVTHDLAALPAEVNVRYLTPEGLRDAPPR